MATENWTNTIADGDYRSPDDLVRALEDFIKGPRLIGNFMGCLVYVDASIPPAQIEIRTNGKALRFSIDHPYIQGTKLEAEARRAIGPSEPAYPPDDNPFP